jgi:uncharacterized protein (TIGR02271 family)
MARIIIGIFETRADAEAVRQDLIQAGLSDQQIRVTSEESLAGTTAKPRAERNTFWDDVRDMFGFGEQDYYEEASRRGHMAVRVDAEEAEVDRTVEVMDRHGAIDIDRRAEEWKQSGWQPKEAGRTEGESVVPVTEEQLKVGKRHEQRGGVRIYSRVVEEPVEQDVTLREEHAHVERRPADRPAGEEAFEEKTIEVAETREEPVVRKEAHVTEEVVVGKDVEEHTETVRDTVRHTEVDVEELENEFRQDYQRSYADRGAYEQYQPAYRLGAELAQDDRFRDEDWSTVAPYARQKFEERQPGNAYRWDEFEEAVHRGFEQTHSRIHAHH